MAVIDPSNPKIVKVFDIMSGKPTSTQIEHSTEILEMDLETGISEIKSKEENNRVRIRFSSNKEKKEND